MSLLERSISTRHYCLFFRTSLIIEINSFPELSKHAVCVGCKTYTSINLIDDSSLVWRRKLQASMVKIPATCVLLITHFDYQPEIPSQRL